MIFVRRPSSVTIETWGRFLFGVPEKLAVKGRARLRPQRRAGVRSRGHSSAREGPPPVSRYFRYRTAEALLADARRMGLDVRLRDDLSPLREAVSVGGRTVGNRLAVQPMEGC